MTYRNRNPTVGRVLESAAFNQVVTLLDHQYRSKWQLEFEASTSWNYDTPYFPLVT